MSDPIYIAYVCGVCRLPILNEEPHSLPDGEDCHEACCPECQAHNQRNPS